MHRKSINLRTNCHDELPFCAKQVGVRRLCVPVGGVGYAEYGARSTVPISVVRAKWVREGRAEILARAVPFHRKKAKFNQ